MRAHPAILSRTLGPSPTSPLSHSSPVLFLFCSTWRLLWVRECDRKPLCAETREQTGWGCALSGILLSLCTHKFLILCYFSHRSMQLRKVHIKNKFCKQNMFFKYTVYPTICFMIICMIWPFTSISRSSIVILLFEQWDLKDSHFYNDKILLWDEVSQVSRSVGKAGRRAKVFYLRDSKMAYHVTCWISAVCELL